MIQCDSSNFGKYRPFSKFIAALKLFLLVSKPRQITMVYHYCFIFFSKLNCNDNV